ncbi:filamentous hemagglutinin N-terminal domain-containing protein [Iningainema tapete]|uniref:Filamentous hemagglutinin N-terminal domain-containing protein n=1 Tax=Iningainema tapete BLCC-T55 TaxID=2748662 RepID=A0A8J6XQS7_9CYAN|nr:filamentous hemagglutinin N-terminal domain-containing protein [Iningainema tapete]MBD2775686.1 filamentous hemagglutinin N-terminal domain-containing protein [Iningainema tapete BLCC-T55]
MSQSWKFYSGQIRLASSMAIGVAIAYCAVDCVFAQSAITPDNTLGSQSSRVDTNQFDGSTEVLRGGVSQGNNLFHSFQEFNVSEGRAAFFLSPGNIQNIVARVTGSNSSKIMGILGTFQTIDGNILPSNANLFLINPNGIIFGPNAVLSVGGSFVGSTASAIKFADGTEFSATSPQTTPLLTVSVPLGLQFGGTATDIRVQGAVSVQPGKTLALVGGNVNLDNGFLQAQGGQIALGGILGEGTIRLNLDSNNQPLSFPNNVPTADVSLSNRAIVDVSGEGGGNIQVQGRRVTLSNGSLLFADTQGSQNGRGISIGAEQLTIQDGSQISASTSGSGTGGSLTVKASDFVQAIGTDADGNPSALFADTFGTGAAGNLTIDTGQLMIENGANVSASTRGNQGRGGTLQVTAAMVKLSGNSAIGNFPSGLFTQTLGSGDAGSLTIDTRQLIVRDGAQVTAGTNINSQGKGGNLTVFASDLVELSGTGLNGSPNSGLFASTRGTGDAGSLTITTGQLIVRDGARVTVAGVESGNAGNLQIQARDLSLDGGKLIAETKSGQGGNITLQGLDLLLLRNNSQITTSADTSQVGADVAGGNIDINSKLIVAVPGENSDITANAFRGRGGNINITTQGIFGVDRRVQETSQTNDITASSQLGINGRIQINTPDVDPDRGTVALPAQVVDVSGQIASGCAAFNGETGSTFVVTGRGGLSPNPYEPLSSDVLWSDTRLSVATNQQRSSKTTTIKPPSASAPVEINPAIGWVFNGKGEVTLIAHAPNTTPYSLGSTGVKCHTLQN